MEHPHLALEAVLAARLAYHELELVAQRIGIRPLLNLEPEPSDLESRDNARDTRVSR